MSSKFLTVPAILAVASLAATPAAAVELPRAGQSPVETTSSYGPWGSIGGGWGGGYRGGHHGGRRGSTAGDILTGVLILGTIAAVANSANRRNRARSYPYPNRYPQPYPNSYPDRYPRPYPDQRGDYRPDARPDAMPSGPQGLQGAADMCLREVERNARAREVTRVERSANGWLVTGAMADGAAFSCSIGADGRIERVDVGGRAQVLGDAGANNDRQYDDARYRSARAVAEAGVQSGPQPAYPGGPLPGEDGAGAPEAAPDS